MPIHVGDNRLLNLELLHVTIQDKMSDQYVEELMRRANQHSHDIDFWLGGADFQYLEILLDEGETVMGEKGSLLYAEAGVETKVRLGDGIEDEEDGWLKKTAKNSVEGLSSAARRKMLKESLFLIHFTNVTSSPKMVALSSALPGQIMPIDLAAHGGEIIAQQKAFFCAAAGTQIKLSLKRKIKSGVFGGEGFVLQRVIGDGFAFLHSYGTVFIKQLAGEEIVVDTGCIVAYQSPNIEFSIEPAGGLMTMAFGGEGVFLTKLSGHGTVWLQSHSKPRMKKKTNKKQPSNKNSKTK